MVADLQQRLTALQVDQVSWQEARRTLEGELAGARGALAAAEETARRGLAKRLLGAACEEAARDCRAISALLDGGKVGTALEGEDPEFIQCRSCPGKL